MELPITEQSNSLSSDIDIQDSDGILRVLKQCDAEIFNGWKQHKSLYDFASSLETLSIMAAQIIKNDRGAVVMSGCGTSGRLGFITARSFNQLFPGKFHYTIAGGDRALLLSTEAPEDSWTDGVRDLEKVSTSFEKVLFIGITCGLSAPYVAGQLDYCMKHLDRFCPVLLGFNPVELARQVSIRNWDKTFYDVGMAMRSLGEPKCYIINPVIGPEPITGSSRMKSGSATKIILETLFILSASKVMELEPQCRASDIFLSYEILCRCTYLQSKNISRLLKAAGNTLCAGGRVCYLGRDTEGILGVVDASECPPTYGADYNDIRGFLQKSWSALGNNEGDLSQRGPLFNLDWEYFKAKVLPLLSEKDCVIFVGVSPNETKDLLQLIQEKTCTIGMITTSSPENISKDPANIISVSISVASEAIKALLPSSFISSSLFTTAAPPPHFIVSLMSGMCIKWSLNAISTGAHIAKGKVLGNKMIDLQVSNTKLYYRSIGIIQELTGASRPVAEKYLLLSIYGFDTELPTTDEEVLSHISAATGKPLIVPTAILMIRKSDLSVEGAHEWLRNQPVLRKGLDNEL